MPVINEMMVPTHIQVSGPHFAYTTSVKSLDLSFCLFSDSEWFMNSAIYSSVPESRTGNRWLFTGWVSKGS